MPELPVCYLLTGDKTHFGSLYAKRLGGFGDEAPTAQSGTMRPTMPGQ